MYICVFCGKYGNICLKRGNEIMKIRKIIALVFALSVCVTGVGTNYTDIPTAAITASAAETNQIKAPENISVYGTSETATVSWWTGNADYYRIYLYDSQTKKYRKYKDTKEHECEITGLKPDTKYKVIVASIGKSNGKTVRKKSKAVTFTTKSAPKGEVCKASDGTVLDPKSAANSDLTTKYSGVEMPEEDKTYLMAYDNSGINFYGMLSSGKSKDYGLYTYIAHDGIVDSFPVRGYNFKAMSSLGEQYFKDIDNDGEKEIVSIAPLSSGTECTIDSLVVYDKDKTGRYKAYSVFDADTSDSDGIFFCESSEFIKIMEKNIDVKLDKKNKTATFKSLNSDAAYVSKTEAESISFSTMYCVYHADKKGKIIMECLPSMGSSPYYEGMPLITSEVVYDGDNFSIANTSFSDWD